MILFVIFSCIILLVLVSLFLYTWYRLYTSLHLNIPPKLEEINRYKLPYQKHVFKTSDGIYISGLSIPAKSSKPVVILIHGYSMEKSWMLTHAQYLYKAGYSTFVIDLRSVGESTGDKIRMAVDEWKDAEAAYDYVKTLPEYNNRKIGFFGISMGATTALLTTGKTGKGDFVIASVPYASLEHQFAFNIRKEKLFTPIFLPLLKLAAVIELGLFYHEYSAINYIAAIHVPLFIIKSLHDEIVPKEDAKLLYDKAHEPKVLWQADAPHDVFKHLPEEGEKRVLEFLGMV